MAHLSMYFLSIEYHYNSQTYTYLMYLPITEDEPSAELYAGLSSIYYLISQSRLLIEGQSIMTEILRDCPAISRQHISDGNKAIIVDSGFGHYAEVLLYHTLLHGLSAMLYDGTVVQIAPVSPHGNLDSRGQITIQTRQRVADPKAKAVEGIANKFFLITIPEEALTEGPLYSPELNATLFLPQHLEFAQHPGNGQMLRTFINTEVAEGLNNTGHSGIVINAVDNYKRITTLYTCIHGRIVAIPVRYRVPTEDEHRAMRTMSLSGETDPDGDPVQPYERIRLTYVLERKQLPYGRDILETFSYSIPKLLRKSTNCWKLGEQWFANDPVVLRRKLAEEPAAGGEMGFTQEAVNEAVSDATRRLNFELDITKSELQISMERTKRAEDALKRIKELPEKISNGEYDITSASTVQAEHKLKQAKVEADYATAKATVIKAQAVAEKARADKLAAESAEAHKTRQALWDTLGHVAKLALAGIMFYAALKGLQLKKA